MDNSCEEIVRQEGVGWVFEKTVPPKGSLIRDALGVRDDGLQSVNVFMSTGDSAIVVPNRKNFANIGSGSFTMGMFFNLPVGSDTGQNHTLIDVYRIIRVFERSGVVYFQVRNADGLVVVSTENSGINFCNGKTYLARFYRDGWSEQNKIGIHVFDVGTYEMNIDSGVNLSFDTELIISGQDVDNGYANFLAAGSFVSGFYLVRDLLTRDDDMAYWLRGEPLVGTQLFLKLDEAVGSVVFDCSGYGNEGYISGFLSSCRATHDRFFSWQNMYGYSTGAHVKLSYPLLDIEDDALVPSIMQSAEFDIFKNPLQFAGRVRLTARIEDIVCLQANGSVWGRAANPQKLQLRPGQDEFAIVGIFERTDVSSGVVMSVGNRYRIEFSGTGKMTLTFGGQITDIDVPIGMSVYLLNVGKTACDVWIDNQLIATVPVGGVYSGGGNADFLAIDGASALNSGAVVFLGVRSGLMTDLERNKWFEYVSLEGNYLAAYYFYSFLETVFDVSGNMNHMSLYSYIDTVWSGRQSVMPYLIGGFTELYNDREDLLNPKVVPYDMFGKKITWNIYGPSQVEIAYDNKGGLLLFDAYINFNPFDKKLGFWTRFWNKTLPEFWVNLDARFLDANPHKWNIQELTMDYLVQSLNPEAYNYGFSGSRTGKFGFTVELVDLVLLNLGNNITNKPIPI